MKLLLFILSLIGIIILSNYINEGFVNYPNAIHDFPKENHYYPCINENVLSSYRLESNRSYDTNKDMYSLNSRILKDKKCAPNGIPTSFF